MTLKEKLDNLKKEIENKIIKGDFETIRAGADSTAGFIGSIEVYVDGIYFKCFISGKRNSLCITEGIDLDLRGAENLKNLSDAWNDNINRDAEIKFLEEKIKQLKNNLL